MFRRSAGGANRREFLRGGLRYALLAGLGAAAVTLVRRPAARFSGQICINDGLCRGCTIFSDCGLPQALSARWAARPTEASKSDSSDRSDPPRAPRS